MQLVWIHRIWFLLCGIPQVYCSGHSVVGNVLNLLECLNKINIVTLNTGIEKVGSNY